MPRSQQEEQGIPLHNTSLLEAGRQALPFQLTAGQDEALQEIVADMAGPAPMLRLLQVNHAAQACMQVSAFWTRLPL